MPARRFIGQKGVSDGQFVADLPGILAEFRLGILPRMISAMLTAALGLIWLPWWSAAIPFAAILAHELVVFPLLLNRFILPAAASGHTAAAVGWYRAGIVTGAAAYTTCWGFLFATGEVIPVFLGACWLWGAALHNQVYFARRPDLYAVSLLPHVAAGLAIPFFIAMPWWGPWLMAICSLTTLANFAIGYVHRRELALKAETEQLARREAEEANLAKSQFLTTMSHELRTPLNAIIGYAEILEEDLESDPELTNPDDARRVRRAARHLLTLINEILDLSRIEAGRLELIAGPVDIAALLQEVEETVRPIGDGNGNRLCLDIVGRLPTLRADGARLKQCVINLATNACKFTRDGRVTIRAEIVARADGPMLEIAVVDTGIGIDREDQARIFQPFVQVDGAETRRQDGTGLGLVITRKLAQAMGGDVRLISTPGLGSTFTLAIPADIAPRAGDTPAEGPHVLVIEDDPTARDLTVRALSRLAFNVQVASSGAQGLQMIADSRPDLVVLDIHLPDISGWEVLSRLKASPEYARLPVLVVTIDDDRARALELGACDHMQKPVQRDALAAAAVRFALVREAPAKPRADTGFDDIAWTA
jgi:signal transduction histidine kinase/CheY-like chemotaxis protein